MAQVTYTNLFSESRTNILNILSDTSKLSDPTISSAEFRKWIYSREPDTKANDFAGYPFIIIHPAEVDIGDKGSVNGKSKPVSWNVEIEIVTSDRGYASRDGQGLSHMDTISNSIFQNLLNVTNRNTLSGLSMKFSQPTTSSVTSEVINNELVFRRSIFAPFRSRIQVSA